MRNRQVDRDVKFGVFGAFLLTLIFLASFYPGFSIFYNNRFYIYIIILIYPLFAHKGKIDSRLFAGGNAFFVFGILVFVVSIINNMRLIDIISPLYLIVCCVLAKCIVGRERNISEINQYLIRKCAIITYIIFLIFYLPGLLYGKDGSAWTYASYLFGALLPFVLWSEENEFKKWIVFVLGVIAVFLTGKRGPFLSILSVAFIYLMSIIFSRNYSRNKRIGYFLMLFLGFFCIFFWATRMLDSMESNTFIRMLDIENELSDSRGPIIEATLEAFSNSNIIQKILGHGFNSVVDDHIYPALGTYLSAHNDFVEILYNVGIIGLTLYVIFLTNVIVAMITLIRSNDRWGYMILASLCTFFIQSYVSHLYLYNYIFHWWIIMWIIGIFKSNTIKRKRYL